MKELSDFKEKIFQIQESKDFEQKALALFNFQSVHNPVYRQFINELKLMPAEVRVIDRIPFLPIEFFKTNKIITGTKEPEKIFASSGTTGQEPSKHYVPDAQLYERSFTRCFELFYGAPNDYAVLALLPSYLERNDASLVYMADKLIKMSGHENSGFFLNNYKQLHKTLSEFEAQGQKVLLIGVSFALWEFAEKFPIALKNTIIMETGGMKGRRREITRAELHGILKQAFDVEQVHSEYGMTELLSQAYAKEEGRFHCPPWMRVFTREINDPFAAAELGQTGVLNIIDLANIYSCAFIATQDLGKRYADGSFEVLGRMDNSEIRGCNLMV